MTVGTQPWILVIDQDRELRLILKSGLEKKGYEVVTAEHAEQTLSMLKGIGNMPGAIVMEFEQPGMTGYELLEHFREQTNVPIVFISTMKNEEQKVKAFEKGADDFVTKPFGIEEVCARIGAVLRRTGRLGSAYTLEPTVTFGKLTVNFYLREVRLGGQLVKLTSTEYDLLKYMIEHDGQVLTHRMLLTAIWGKEHAGRVQYLRVYIGQLRKKIDKESKGQTFIQTDSGVGYRFIGGI